MNKAETNRFNELYQRHLLLLKLQGKPKKPLMPTPGPYVESGIISIAAPIY